MSVITKCHSVESHSWSSKAFAWMVIVVSPPPVVVDVLVVPVVPVDVEAVVPPDVLVPVDVPVVVLVDVPVEVPVDVPVDVVPDPQFTVKLRNLSPPAAGVLCRAWTV